MIARVELLQRYTTILTHLAGVMGRRRREDG
jgi:hypothetical protein